MSSTAIGDGPPVEASARDGAVDGAVEGVSVQRVVVWRHGQTTWNAIGRFQGQADPPLDRVGQEQSRVAAGYLAVDPPDLILTSDLQRAASTAQALTRLIERPVRIEPRLREIELGAWQGLTRDEVAATYPEQYADWLDGRPPVDRGGESRAQLDARVMAALADIEVDHVLLVTHGGTARSIIETLLGLSHAGRWLAVLGNCQWSELQRYPGGWQLRAHNLAAPSETMLRPAGLRPDQVGDADVVADGLLPDGSTDDTALDDTALDDAGVGR
ncbi:MAG: histidine phosphatase family protein [Geodermatophilaceae bacterium]|nr:histidine phosphatase family protein [Geodermatophilaceae bacterium]